MGNIIVGKYIIYMFIACLLLIFFTLKQRYCKVKLIIFLLVSLFGASIFNYIVHEGYSHYNSYRYLFIIMAFYFIFINITKDVRYKYTVFLSSLCMGYILVILLLPSFNIFRVYTIYGNFYFICFFFEFLQSFIVSTLSFFLCKIVTFVSELFVLEETDSNFKCCIIIKYLIHQNYLSLSVFLMWRELSCFYKLEDIMIYLFGYIFNPKKEFKYNHIKTFFQVVLIIIIMILIYHVYSSNPTRHLRAKLQYHNNTWHVLIDNTHNKLIKSSSDNYISGSESNIKTATLSHNNNRKYFYINNNKLYIRPNVLSYPHLGKIDKKSPLIFYGISRGAYHFSGVVNVKKNAHFSSKADINIYLSQHKSQLRMVRHDIRK